MEVPLLALVVAVALIEVVLSGTWSPFYFTRGLPLFRRKVAIPSLGALVEERLEQAHAGGLVPPLLFRRLSGTEIAFREKALAIRLLSHTPVMHGLIRQDRDEGNVYVIGLANWFPLAFAVFFMAMTLHWDPTCLIFLFLVLGLIYAIQARRYASVARFLDSPAERSAAGSTGSLGRTS